MFTIQEQHEPISSLPKLSSRMSKQQSNAGLAIAPKRSNDPMSDESYVRRLKKANYGKWYIQPEDYNKRVDFITQQMQKQ